MKRSARRILALGLLSAVFVCNLILLYSVGWTVDIHVRFRGESLRHRFQNGMGQSQERETASSQVDASESQAAPSTLKIVGFTDKRYLPVTRKWYDRLVELGYRPSEIDIVCADAESLQNLTAAGIPGVRDMVIPDPDLKKKARGFLRQFYMHRIRYTITRLKAGVSMLITDVDNVFLNYVPLSRFYNEGYDIIHAYALGYPQEPYAKMGFTVCAGLQWLRATPETIAFLEMIQDLCAKNKDDGKCDDQVAFNEALAGPAAVIWDREPNRPDAIRTPVLRKQTYLTETITGRCPATNHTVKVWDRDFATRWPGEPRICPSQDGWIAAPIVDVPGFRAHYPNVNFLAGKKLAMMDRWMEWCGPNGTKPKRSTSFATWEKA